MRIPHARGFTLFEVIVASMFVLILIQLVAVFGLKAIYIQEMDQVRESVRKDLVYARDHAISGSGSASTWGVAFTTSTIIKFKGASYASRDPVFDFETDFGPRITFGGADEIVFLPPFGEAQASGTITITNGVDYATATVNPYGTVEIQ
jgi:Tfp pilus assembly protein FimT